MIDGRTGGRGSPSSSISRYKASYSSSQLLLPRALALSLEAKSTVVAVENNGAARGIRTPDPIITNDVLYRLSYCGGFRGW